MTEFLDLFGAYDFAARQALILMLVGLSVYVLLRAGMFAVPQIGFMAIGGYTSALLALEAGWPFPVTLACAGALTGLVAIIVGGLLARLSGIYLAIATIGFSEIVRETLTNVGFTGGPQGLFGIPREANDLYIAGTLLAAVVLLLRLERTRFGLAMAGIREEPLMTSHQGVNLRVSRLALFGVSGVLAGLAGALFVHQSGFIDPSTYSFGLLVQVLAAVILGGMTSVFGPLLGGVFIFGLPQFLGSFEEYRNLVNGTLIVLVIALLPSGLVGAFSTLRRWGSSAVRHGRVGGTAVDEQSAAAAVVAKPARVVEGGPPAPPACPQVLLDLREIKKHFGGIKALQGVSLQVSEREVFGIIGPNGSGKTTLLNVLSGVYRPDGGEGSLDGTAIAHLWGHPDKLAQQGIARTFQGIRLLGDYSVVDNVLLGTYQRQEAGAPMAVLGMAGARQEARQAREHAMQALEELNLAAVAQTAAGSLPYGLQRKVEIARALVSKPKLLLLDEPTAGMTPQERDEIFQEVQAVRDRGVTVLVVEHDVAAMSRHCDRVAVLNFGRTLAVGNPDQVMEDEEVIDAYIGRPVARP